MAMETYLCDIALDGGTGCGGFMDRLEDFLEPSGLGSPRGHFRWMGRGRTRTPIILVDIGHGHGVTQHRWLIGHSTCFLPSPHRDNLMGLVHRASDVIALFPPVRRRLGHRPYPFTLTNSNSSHGASASE